MAALRLDGKRPIRRNEGGRFTAVDPSGGPSAPLGARIPATLLERFDATATAERMTRSEAIREALEEWLASRE